MSRRSKALLLAFLAVAALHAAEPAKDIRHFMFVGEPNADAWKYLMANPGDRKAAVSEAFRALGGEVVSYYFGLGNGKNYITVTLPNDNELIQAVYLMRLASGMLASYQVIELMPSEQMSDALKRAKKLIERDTTVKGKQQE